MADPQTLSGAQRRPAARRLPPRSAAAARPRRLERAAPWLAPPCLALLLTSCAPAEEDQVVARVNGAAIVAREVDLALQREGSAAPRPEEADGSRRHLLHSLIIEELMAQQFRRTVPGSAEIDKSAINAARRDVLARHFVATLAAGTPPPDCDEVRAYYRDNPRLFAQRRLFELRQLEVALPPAREAELRARLAAAASLDDVLAWLRTAELRFVMSQTERASDELSSELRARLLDMTAGQVAILPAPQGMHIVQLVGSRPAPLEEDQARPLIARRLWMDRQAQALEAEIRKLSRMAAISLPGEGSPAIRAPVLASAMDAPVLAMDARAAAFPACTRGPARAQIWSHKDAQEAHK